MDKIIRDDGIVEPQSLPNTRIYGGEGDHATDLLSRDLLVSGTEQDTAHIITLPITVTGLAIRELLESGISQQDIVSLAGVMTTSPNGAHTIHYTFGTGAEAKANKPLKVIFANTSPDSPLVEALKLQAQLKSLKIIETSRIEHDKKMGYTQGLMHLWLVLAGMNAHQNDGIKTSLITPWKTPAQTVIDMIHANPFAEESIKNFFDALPRCDYNLGDTLQEVLEDLSIKDLDNFGTPNSDRIVNFIGQTGHTIISSREQVHKTRAALNTQGYRFLREQITAIRTSTPS